MSAEISFYSRGGSIPCSLKAQITATYVTNSGEFTCIQITLIRILAKIRYSKWNESLFRVEDRNSILACMEYGEWSFKSSELRIEVRGNNEQMDALAFEKLTNYMTCTMYS